MQFDPTQYNTKPANSPVVETKQPTTAVFNASMFNTKPVNELVPKPTSFDPKAALMQLNIEREERKREILIANDPTKLRIPEVFGPVKAWSFSALKKYESCAHATYLGKVEKIKETSGPAAERGSMIHDRAEKFIRGELGEDVPHLLSKVKARVLELRERFERQPFPMTMEEDWGFTVQWKPTGWTDADTWCRQKLDVFYQDSATSAVIVDWKSGKKFGNEIKHGEQALHYAIGAFMKYPFLDYLQTEFQYTDLGEKMTKNYTRDRALLHMPKIHERAIIMTTATSFPPNPSKVNCRYCYYRESGDCDYAHDQI
jgi:CRISPR/Cas system-associated exonuclease Cas4 (RecB family)